MTRLRALLLVLLTAGCAVAISYLRLPHDVRRREGYQRVLPAVCVTGVTPELIAQHQRAVAAVDREASVVDVVPHVARVTGKPITSKQLMRFTVTNPHGKTTNFWGPKPLDLAYANCTQAP